MRELSKKYKTHHKNITQCLNDNNIVKRTLNECNKIAREKYPYLHSDKTKKLLSDLHRKNN